ncbi:hypothetical protein ACLOJK_005747 [Asimina triloba]
MVIYVRSWDCRISTVARENGFPNLESLLPMERRDRRPHAIAGGETLFGHGEEVAVELWDVVAALIYRSRWVAAITEYSPLLLFFLVSAHCHGRLPVALLSMAATTQSVGFEGDVDRLLDLEWAGCCRLFAWIELANWTSPEVDIADSLLGKMENHTSVFRRFTETNAHAHVIGVM